MDEDQKYRCEFAVEATDFEVKVLRSRFRKRIKSWKENDGGSGMALGSCANVGSIKGRPIIIGFWFVHLDGHRVCFYNPISELQDFALINKWLDEKCLPPLGKGEVVRRCNAGSFRQCLNMLNISVKPSKLELKYLGPRPPAPTP
jgi:hypothetical protein